MKKILNEIYLSEWFDPIYRLTKIPHRIYHKIEKFIYYGYYGSMCWDFDANCINTLIYAHMKRVNKFMNSNKTHLLWNNRIDTKGMRLLAEFTELSKRMSENELRSYTFYGKVREKFPEETKTLLFNSENKEFKRLMRIAFKKDRAICEQLTERYYYLLKKEVPGFWD